MNCAGCGDDIHILVDGGTPRAFYCYACRVKKDAEGTGEKFPFNFLWSMTDEELEALDNYAENTVE